MVGDGGGAPGWYLLGPGGGGGGHFRSRLPCPRLYKVVPHTKRVDLATPGSGGDGGGGGGGGGSSWVVPPGSQGGGHFRSRLPCLVYIRPCTTQV